MTELQLLIYKKKTNRTLNWQYKLSRLMRNLTVMWNKRRKNHSLPALFHFFLFHFDGQTENITTFQCHDFSFQLNVVLFWTLLTANTRYIHSKTSAINLHERQVKCYWILIRPTRLYFSIKNKYQNTRLFSVSLLYL